MADSRSRIACCIGPVGVVNGCFQYCRAPGDPTEFNTCVTTYAVNVTEMGALLTTCSSGRDKIQNTSGGDRSVRRGWAGTLGLVLLGFLVLG